MASSPHHARVLVPCERFGTKVATACGEYLNNANQLLVAMKKAAAEGGAENLLHPVPGEAWFVSYFDASLGKSEAMTAQQAEIHFLTGVEVEKKPTKANMLEFNSSKVHRVVRSSLAAESCAMTSAADKILYNRALFGALFHGQEVAMEAGVESWWHHHH